MRQRGFTLLELLVALMIGVLVSMSLGLITKTMAVEADNQQMLTEASQSARSGIDMIRLDLMRVGMFVAANPRSDQNVNSLTTSSGAAGTQAGYYRNPIVHLNPDSDKPDALVLVGNFIGDRAYEGEIDVEGGSGLTITSTISRDNCLREFNPAYAYAHIITATGQTHEARIVSATPNGCNGDGSVCQCIVGLANGEIIDGAFGERHVKVAANQAIMYKVVQNKGRKTLMRYFIDYDGTNPGVSNCVDPVNAVDYQVFSSATMVADNVTDFQVWFRAIDPNEVGGISDKAIYHSPSVIAGAQSPLVPLRANVIFGEAAPNAPTSGIHLSCPVAGGGSNVIKPENVRSAMISLAVRTEQPDISLDSQYDTDTGDANLQGASDLVNRELYASPAGKVGFYKVRRYTVEVPLPNIDSQMALFQWTGAPPVY